MASCQAISGKTKSGKCECAEFSLDASKKGIYEVCAVSSCGHSRQIHYEPSGEVKKVKR